MPDYTKMYNDNIKLCFDILKDINGFSFPAEKKTAYQTAEAKKAILAEFDSAKASHEAVNWSKIANIAMYADNTTTPTHLTKRSQTMKKKNKYYIVDIESQSVLGEFTNLNDARSFQMYHKITSSSQIWGYHPSELRPSKS